MFELRCAFVFLYLSGGLADAGILNVIRTIENQFDYDLENENVRLSLERKCLINGGPETFDDLLEAKAELESCLNFAFGYGNISKLIELSQKNEEVLLEYVDEYCTTMTAVKNCVSHAIQVFEKCFNEHEKMSFRFVASVFSSLANFTCYKDGDCVIFFIAEGGPKCMMDKNNELRDCTVDIMRGVSFNNLHIGSLPLLINYTTVCDDFLKLQDCIVRNLEDCDDVTPANVVGSLFTFILKNYSC